MNADYLQQLKKGRFKITPKRRAILELFDQKDKCLSPEAIWDHLKKTFKRSGLPSVYRNLEIFVKQGILVRVDREGRKRYYALCHDHSGHHHHHIVCVDCGKVDDLPECPLPDLKGIKGFKILNHSMQINGICNECSSK
ncbi:MAG: transcriptional repressor [Candidatus Omnitrophica bacterium]|nr:transcriptional repressor [Candidatus Omnitrophota bacterium]